MRAIHSALCEPAAWREALERLRARFASDACALARYDLDRGLAEYLYRSRLRPDLEDGAAVSDLAERPWRERLRYAEPGERWLDASLTTRDELLASGFHRQWLAPDGLDHFSCGIVGREGDTVLALEHFRRAGRPAFGHRHLVIYDLFLPHLERACDLCRLLRDEAAGAAALAGALRGVPAAVVVTDARGRVMAASEAARRTVVVDAEGEGDALPAAVEGSSPLLHRAVTGAALAVAQDPAASRHQVVLHQMPGGREVRAEIVPLHAAATARVGVVLQPHAEGGLDRARWRQEAMSTAYFRRAPAADRLRLLYGLTPAEARLALCLADGSSPGEAAVQLGVRPNTVRTHLQRIYDKTGTHRQAELLRLLLTGPHAEGPG